MHIHWVLKLPDLRRDGDHVHRDAESFRALLETCGDAKQARLHEKWNALDFRRQMAIVVMHTYGNTGHDHAITSVWKTDREILVVVARRHPAHGAKVFLSFTHPTSGVAINRSDLPVRFIWICKSRL